MTSKILGTVGNREGFEGKSTRFKPQVGHKLHQIVLAAFAVAATIGLFAAAVSGVRAARPDFEAPEAATVFCTPGATPVLLRDIGSGRSGIGVADAQWQLTSAPAGVVTPSAYGVNGFGGWVSPSSGSGDTWIDASTAGAISNASDPNSARFGGTYVYSLSFTVPASYTSPFVTIQFAADNGVQFYLNSIPISGASAASPYGFHALHGPVTFAAPTGANILEAHVHNVSNVTGLLVEGKVCATPVIYCIPGATPVQVENIGTGRSGFGVVDAQWHLTSAPAGVSTPNAYGVPAYPGWVSPTSGSGDSWIDASTAGAISAANDPSAATQGGTYVYSLSFTVPTSYTSPFVTMQFAADNGVQFYLNSSPVSGASAASPYGFQTLHSPVTFSVPAGANTLEAHVQNMSNVTGLLVEGKVCGTP